MTARWVTLVGAGLVCAVAMGAETARPSIPPKRISFYAVPFVCPAAPQIGCGSRSKPVLLDLEAQQPVAEAWLNREGTRMGIVWKPDTKRRQRHAALKQVTTKDGFEARELSGKERETALKDFLSGTDWLRGRDVDRLSREEAAILAGRLMRKVRSLVSLTEQKAGTLQQQFTETIAHRLTGQLPDRDSAQQEILRILRQQLSEKEVELLQQALRDYRPGQDGPD